MTREERLKLLKQIEKDIYIPSIESTLFDDMKNCAIHSVIEELEQEPILSKIRKIINEWQLDSWTDNLSYECMIKIAKLVEPQEI